MKVWGPAARHVSAVRHLAYCAKICAKMFQIGTCGTKNTEGTGLSLTLSETPKTGFLATRPIYEMSKKCFRAFTVYSKSTNLVILLL